MYIGIDLGTSELKAVLLAPDHRIIAQSAQRLEVSQPHPLWSEQSPQAWQAAMVAAVDELAKRAPAAMRGVRGIGLAGQQHGAVVLDQHFVPLRPAILWNDSRSHVECLELDKACPHAVHLTGNYAMPGFTAPKLLWLRKHEPELFAKVHMVLLPKDYLRLCLTGETITDMSDASGTFWLDIEKRDWSDELLQACGLNRKHMPRLAEGSEKAGSLKPEWAQRWGMQEPVFIAGGAGDNAASAVGMGVVEPGDGILSLGTSGVIFRTTKTFKPNAKSCIHAFCHALPQTWHQMSVMLSAASSLRWVVNLTGSKNEQALLDEIALLGETEKATAPLFLPYLSGERTPHNNAHAKAGFLGLTHTHGAAALGYAVLEGVGFGLKDGFLALGQEAGQNSLLLVGGGSRSLLWNQMLADILETSLSCAEGSEQAGAVGAARLAWMADGAEKDVVCPAPILKATFVAQNPFSKARYERFKAAFPAALM